MIPEAGIDVSIIVISFNATDETLNGLTSINEQAEGINY